MGEEKLPNMVEMAIGMKVMVTINISTDLDIANGTHGEIVDIVLNEQEEIVDPDRAIIKLQFPSC
jgi:hypothetical protein